MSKIYFPTALRKMWSGTEVQAWLDEHVAKNPPPALGLTFETLREANRQRLPQFKNGKGVLAHAFEDGSDWSPSDWLGALVGELGEYANFAKKFKRGDITKEEFALKGGKELADVAIYLDILARRCLDTYNKADEHGIDLAVAIQSKFNEVSERVNSTVFLSEEFGLVNVLRSKDDPFVAGDVVRYGDGGTALARLLQPHARGWHARQCYGGFLYLNDSDLEHATAADMEVWASKEKERVRR